jgi:hypothetical protein
LTSAFKPPRSLFSQTGALQVLQQESFPGPRRAYHFYQGISMSQNQYFRCFALAAVFALGACANVDRQKVERSGYLQVIDDAGVLLETEASRSNCETMARIMQVHDSAKGRLRCASRPTDDLMPFSYRSRGMKSATTDHMRPSMTYLVRARTSTQCELSLAGARRNEKLEILEDKCGEARAATDSSASGGLHGRYFSMWSNRELHLQIALGSVRECLEYLRTVETLRQEKIAQTGTRLECMRTDAGSKLQHRITVHDDVDGTQLTIAARSVALCENSAAEFKQIMIEGSKRPRYSARGVCAELREVP